MSDKDSKLRELVKDFEKDAVWLETGPMDEWDAPKSIRRCASKLKAILDSEPKGDWIGVKREDFFEVLCLAYELLPDPESERKLDALKEKYAINPSPPVIEPSEDKVVLSYKEREEYACDVCSNVPDEEGTIEHGRGCYTQSEDGGGVSYVDFEPSEDKGCKNPDCVDGKAPVEHYTGLVFREPCPYCNGAKAQKEYKKSPSPLAMEPSEYNGECINHHSDGSKIFSNQHNFNCPDCIRDSAKKGGE